MRNEALIMRSGRVVQASPVSFQIKIKYVCVHMYMYAMTEYPYFDGILSS